MQRPGPAAPPRPEFSRPMRVAGLSRDGETVVATADADERAALARRYGVRAVPHLEVEARILPDADGWRGEGVVRAKVVQACVVWLVDVPQRIEEPFARRFHPGAPAPDLADLDPEEEEDPPEPLPAVLDPGEMAAEAVALAIDPYPRAPDAVFEGRASRPEGAAPLPEGRPNPFARLAALKGGEAPPEED
jgi:hypothetical protein